MMWIFSMAKVKYFRAAKKTKRFNENQKVWVRLLLANHMHVWYRHRGNGRYVEGMIDRCAPCVGEIKTIEVDNDFAKRVVGA